MTIRILGSILLIMMIGGLVIQPVAAQTLATTNSDFIQLADPALASSTNFSRAFKADFNNDGVLDRVNCNNSDYSVKVYDGKKLKNILYEWSGPATNTLVTDESHPKIISKRVYTGCTVVEIVPGRPSIVLADSFLHPTLGFRIQADQFVLLNQGLSANGKLKLVPHIVRKPDNTVYRAPVRSVKCTTYPESLVQAGGTPGALCFYAGYDQGWLNGYGNRVALLKLEDSNGTLVIKDLTASAGLPWTGGVEGTPMSKFRTYKNVSGATKSDGLSMMGGAWLDYDKDGLPDLITVGQHSSIWAFKMAINNAKLEGISFTKSDIMTASNNSMTEFLTVSAFNEQDSRIQLPCVYITGEVNNIFKVKSYDVPDHVRCYEDGAWKTHLLPGGKSYSSALRGSSIKIDSSGRILALAPSFYYTTKMPNGDVVQKGPDSGIQTPMSPRTNLFEFRSMDTCEVQVDSKLMRGDETIVVKSTTETLSVPRGSSLRIGGWVDCNTTTHDAKFTKTTLTSGTSNITQLGFWTETDFVLHEADFRAIQWKNSGSLLAAAGVEKIVGLRNACAGTTAKITATVLSCTNNAINMDTRTARALPDNGEQTGEELAATTVSTDVISFVVSQLQLILMQFKILVGK